LQFSAGMEKPSEAPKPRAVEAEGERLVVVRESPFNAETPADALAEPISRPHFVRSHFDPPPIDATYAGEHRLRVGGAVARPLVLSLAELRATAWHETVVTLECAGNGRTHMRPLPGGEPWMDGAVGTARWGGVPLRHVLERAMLSSSAVEILAVGADHGMPHGDGAPRDIPFARSLPLDKALDEDTLLALEMNGAPLPLHHGAPLRLIVPRWFGVASVKWLERIDAITEPFDGWFQEARYVYSYTDDQPTQPVRELRCKSMIVSPSDGAQVARGRVEIRGWAWSGSAELASVEVSVDASDRWQLATLDPPLSPNAWRGFRCTWDAQPRGRHTLRARATDAAGNRQPDWPRNNRFGYGNNSVRPVVVDVR